MQNYQNHPLAGAMDLDSAMVKLWAFYKKYFIGLYIISVLSALVANLIGATLDLTSLQSTTDPAEILSLVKDMALPYTLLILVSIVFSVVLHAYVLDKPLNQDYSFARTLQDSAVAFFPYILAAIVLGIGGVVLIGIGLVMLILPGIFAMFYFVTVIIFALPVTLAESRNPGTIIGKSIQLAHKNFWPNMGWVVVIALIMLIASLVIAGIIMLPFTGTFIKSLTNPEEAAAFLEMAKNPAYIGLSSLASALVTPIFPILAFILYFRNSEDLSQSMQSVGDENKVKVEDLYPKMPERE